MTQSRYSVLVGIFLLVALTGGFFLAGRVVFSKIHTSIEAAIATSTTTPMPPATPTPAHARPTPVHGQHPTSNTPPTSTPGSSSYQVIMSTAPSMSNPMTTIPSDTSQFFCVVNMPAAPANAPLLFKFQKLSVAEDYFDHPAFVDSYAGPLKFSFIYGPLQPGQWRCEVELSGQLIGTAPFTVQ